MNQRILLSAALLWAVLVGCQVPGSPSGARTLTLSLEAGSRTTVLPSSYPSVATYSIVLHPSSGPDVTVEETSTSWAPIGGLLPAAYDVTVTGRLADGTPAQTGTATVDLSSTLSAAATVTLGWITSGTGTGTLSVDYRSSGPTTLSEWTFTIVFPDGSTVHPALSGPGSASVDYTYSGSFPAGSYVVQACLKTATSTYWFAHTAVVVPGGTTLVLANFAYGVDPTTVESIGLDAPFNLLAGGDPQALTPTVLPASATYPVFTWSSSDPSVASVDQDGNVTPRHAGTATIAAAWVFDPTVKGTTTVTVLDIGKTIYVAGNLAYGAPGYWKNGAWTSLPSCNATAANRVAGLRVTSGGVIYVAGSYWDGGAWAPVVWKNGAATTSSISGRHTTANSITVASDGTVYLGGHSWTFTGSMNYANGWTLDAALTLAPADVLNNAQGAAAFGVAASGADVYLVGSNYNEAVVFKNGTKISMGASGPVLYGIAAVGTTLYVAGASSNDPAVRTSTDGGTTWGSYTVLPRSNTANAGYASKVYLDGGDVYACGSDGTNAVYWKNGVEHDLGVPGQATSIVVANGHVLVTGTDRVPYFINELTSYLGNTKAYLWVDDQLVTLASRPGGTSVNCYAAEVWVP